MVRFTEGDSVILTSPDATYTSAGSAELPSRLTPGVHRVLRNYRHSDGAPVDGDYCVCNSDGTRVGWVNERFLRLDTDADNVVETDAAVTALRAALSPTPDDNLEDGTVIRWTRNIWHRCVAVKSGGLYVTTGMGDKRTQSYEELIQTLQGPNVTDIEVATGWRSVT